MDFLGLLGAGAAAGADGPDRLIGQDHARHGFGAQGQHGLELALNDGQRVAGVAIGQRFAHADHGSQAGGQRGARLVRHDLVRLAVQHATLGVAGQGPAAAEFLQHRAGDFARVGALFLSADILRTPADAAAGQGGSGLGQVRERHANADLAMAGGIHGAQFGQQRGVLGQVAVHLPVAQHEAGAVFD